MKRIVLLLLIFVGGVSLVKAYDGILQHLSPEEFKTKQQKFITEKAALTTAEAEKFFPIYFELQDKKKELNDQMWNLLRKGRDGKLSETQYDEIMQSVHDLRIESAQLEKSYYTKFRKVLSAQKLYEVQKAETRFHRELVKDAGNRGRGGNPSQQQQGKK